MNEFEVKYLLSGQGPRTLFLETSNPDETDIANDAVYEVCKQEGVHESQITILAIDDI
jgi:hypothetical protein